MNLQPSELLGLPAHPLIVHFAVVLVPLAVGGFLGTGWRPRWRRRFGGAVAAIAVAGAIAAVLAAQSGKALEGPVRRAAAAGGAEAHYGRHPQFGTYAEVGALAFAAAVTAVWLCDEWRQRWSSRRLAASCGYLLGAAFGLVALATMVAAGHSGAALVWRDVGSFPAGRTATPTGPAARVSPAAAAPAGATVVAMAEFRFDPAEIRAAPGEVIVIEAENRGRVLHSFALNGLRVSSGAIVPAGSAELRFTAPPAPGRYQIVCNEEGHEEEGMVGALVVE